MLQEKEGKVNEHQHLLQENVRLNGIVKELEGKNMRMGELLDRNLYNRAEDYKNKVIGALIKPKPVLRGDFNDKPENLKSLSQMQFNTTIVAS